LSPLRLTPLLLSALLALRAVVGQDLAVELAAVGGLSEQRIGAVCETADGRLWFGGGQLWFHDGRRVVDVELPSVPGVRSRIRQLIPAPDGGLFAVMLEGMCHVEADATVASELAATRGLRVYRAAVAPQGDLYVLTADGLARCGEGGELRAVPTPGNAHVTGLAVDRDLLWVWNANRVWCTRAGEVLSSSEMALRSAAADGGALVFRSDEGIGRLAPDGGVTWLHRGASSGELLVARDAYWLRALARLFRLPRTGGEPERVFLHRDGLAISREHLLAVAVDRRGLVWLGTDHGLHRLCISDGVENVRLSLLDPGERVSGIAVRADGTICVATATGRLLESAAATGAPWREHAMPVRAQLSALAFDADDRLWVAAGNDGLWQCGPDGWRRVLEVERGGTFDVTWHRGVIWCATHRNVWRIVGDERVDVPMRRAEAAASRALPRAFTVVGDELWLGTFGNSGVFRLDEARMQFDHVALNENALVSAACVDGDGLIVGTLHDVFDIDERGDAHRLPIDCSAPVRALRCVSNDRLWLTRPRALTSFEGGVERTISVDSGAHPLGYTYGATAQLADGSMLFGANGGFTRVAADASLRAAEHVSVERAWLSDGTGGGRRRALSTDGPLLVHNRAVYAEVDLHDAARGLPRGVTFELRPDDGGEVLRSRVGEFRVPSTGGYSVVVRFPRRTGSSAEVRLGSIRVSDPWPRWLLPSLLSLVLLPLVVVAWRRARRVDVAGARRRAANALATLGGDADEVLDLAFVVVAAVETALEATAYLHCSVRLRLGDRPSLLLSESGGICTDCDDRVEKVLADGEELRPGLWRVRRDDRCDVVFVLEAEDSVRFKVFVSLDLRRGDEQALQLDEALKPARAALSRFVWLSRLQHYCVRSGMSLEADLHDLRSPLTALRIGIDDLVAEHGESEPTLRAVASATDNLIRAVDRLQSPDGIECRPHDVLAVVGKVVADAERVAVERSIALRLHRPEMAELSVAIDPIWFSRALENVVGNALKYTPSGGGVDVRVAVDGGNVCIIVDDEGPGILPEEYDYVFLPGVTGGEQPGHGEKQGGIGLWVSRQAIRAMGGRLWIASNERGGASVRMELPLLQPSDR